MSWFNIVFFGIVYLYLFLIEAFLAFFEKKVETMRIVSGTDLLNFKVLNEYVFLNEIAVFYGRGKLKSTFKCFLTRQS